MNLKTLLETSGDELEGNTKSNSSLCVKGNVVVDPVVKQVKTEPIKEIVKSKRNVQRKYWAFTLFYKDYCEVERVETILYGLCDKYIIGKETCPNTGRLHLQGFVGFKGKGKRFNEIESLFKWHIEPCKGSEEQNVKYCSKDKNYIKHGFPLDVTVIENLRPYQSEIVNIVKGKPNDRLVYWYYDSKGNIGKSAMCKYLIKTFNSLLITGGKKSDIINVVYNAKDEISYGRCNSVVIDIPRTEHNACSYQAIEEIKNGMICNTKYETGSFIFNAMHVIVFSNFMPDITKLSMDRWKISEILPDYTIKNVNINMVNYEMIVDALQNDE